MSEPVKDSQGPNKATRTREDFFNEFLSVIRVPLVKSVAEGFFSNIRQVESLLQMPYVMFGFIEVDHALVRELEASAREHWNRGMDFGAFLYAHYSPKPLNIVERTPDLFENIGKRFKEAPLEPQLRPILGFVNASHLRSSHLRKLDRT
jgi:hypothetical protein